MSLFRRAGRKFEEQKQRVMGDGEAEYVCRSCRESLSDEHDYCPHCGAETIEPVE